MISTVRRGRTLLGRADTEPTRASATQLIIPSVFFGNDFEAASCYRPATFGPTQTSWGMKGFRCQGFMNILNNTPPPPPPTFLARSCNHLVFHITSERQPLGARGGGFQCCLRILPKFFLNFGRIYCCNCAIQTLKKKKKTFKISTAVHVVATLDDMLCCIVKLSPCIMKIIF